MLPPNSQMPRKIPTGKTFSGVHLVHSILVSLSYPILMGDFNTRLHTNHIAGLGRHIGPALFSTSTEADLETNNLTHMIEFLVQHDLSIISSMRPRPPSKLVTYREIADLTDDPFHPNVDNFAVLDHVLAPF